MKLSLIPVFQFIQSLVILKILVCPDQVVFNNNHSDNFGGAIYNGDGGSPNISRCTMYRNTANSGGGIANIGSSPTINSVIIDSCSKGFGIYYGTGSSSSVVTYSDFNNNFPVNFGGSDVPANLGNITTTNTNGDPCDIFSNIFVDPLFVDKKVDDLHLQSSSPCIDAGDPNILLDPDNTVTDIGAFYFKQLYPRIFTNDTLLYFDKVIIGQPKDLPLTIQNIGTDSLLLHSITNQQSVFTHNWSSMDSLILPGNNLNVTITFTPLDTNLITDTLLIENNDKPLQIKLSGKGKILTAIEDKNDLPKTYALYAAYPNPFNPSTRITYSVPKLSNITIKIFDILGNNLRTLVDEEKPAGTYEVMWNADNLTSGVYFYRLQAGSFVETKKMILMK